MKRDVTSTMKSIAGYIGVAWEVKSANKNVYLTPSCHRDVTYADVSASTIFNDVTHIALPLNTGRFKSYGESIVRRQKCDKRKERGDTRKNGSID